MSANKMDLGAIDACCANCGRAEIDDVKLKDCDKCDLARYCGDKCQQDHREKHEAICKERAAEIRDEILFQQPESSCFGDCPICFLPMPVDRSKSTMNSCCGKKICNGCAFTNKLREMEQRLEQRCQFCRKLLPDTKEESKIRLMKRVEANDPAALQQMGMMHYNKGDYDKSLECYLRASELGDADAHYNLSVLYREGQGVEKDEEMKIYHLEKAAIAGHPKARYHLGVYEAINERYDRAVRHWIIATNLGYDKSLQALKECYKDGLVNKDDLAAALRAYQAAVDATKSPQREVAEKYM